MAGRHEPNTEGPDIRGNVGRGRDSDPPGAHAESYIMDMEYPARKGDLVERARREGAAEDIREFLDRLPDQEFHSPEEVYRAIGGMAGAREEDDGA